MWRPGAGTIPPSFVDAHGPGHLRYSCRDELLDTLDVLQYVDPGDDGELVGHDVGPARGLELKLSRKQSMGSGDEGEICRPCPARTREQSIVVPNRYAFGDEPLEASLEPADDVALHPEGLVPVVPLQLTECYQES
jgi:hypothetical protein